MKRRNIAIEDGNKKLVCVTSFRHIRDNAVKMLSERHQTCMSGGATSKKPLLSSYYFDSILESIGRAKIFFAFLFELHHLEISRGYYVMLLRLLAT